MIKKNLAKEKIKNGEPILMGFTGINDSVSAEIMALSGVDIIIIDNEHMAFDDEHIFNIARAVQLHESTCLLRTAIKDIMELTRYMELGIDGICATQTKSLEDAKKIINAVKYPPIGKRGLCNYSRGFNFGFLDGMSVQEYMNFANENTLVFVTLESLDGIKDVEQIAKLEDIDSVHIGPNDLSASMGFGGNTKEQEVIEIVQKAQEKIIAAGNTTGKYATSLDEIPVLIERGEKILMLGSDVVHLRNALTIIGETFKNAMSK